MFIPIPKPKEMTPEKEQKLREAAENIIKDGGWWPYHDTALNARIPTKYVLEFMIRLAKSTEVAEYHKQSPAESDGWISIEERLPEERINTVLAFNANAPEYNQHVFLADYFTQTKSWSPSHKIMGRVTHWQPLPAVPKPKN